MEISVWLVTALTHLLVVVVVGVNVVLVLLVSHVLLVTQLAVKSGVSFFLKKDGEVDGNYEDQFENVFFFLFVCMFCLFLMERCTNVHFVDEFLIEKYQRSFSDMFFFFFFTPLVPKIDLQ